MQEKISNEVEQNQFAWLKYTKFAKGEMENDSELFFISWTKNHCIEFAT